MAKTAIQQRLGAITLPPTPKTGRSLKEVELATATWTKQAQQSLKRIAEVLGTLTTGQIPEGGTEVIGNVPTPPGVFFTNERARAAVSATSPVLYDQPTGVFSIQLAKADGAFLGAAAFVAADFNDDGSGVISLDYVNGQKASGSLNGFLSSTDWTTFNNKVSTARAINTTSPLLGGGDLSADRTLSIQFAKADASTVGAATFAVNDFDDNGSGLLSIDYTNGQKASGSVPGFLSSTDWTTFNNKVSTTRAINTTSPLLGGGDLSADRTFSIQDAAADGTTKGAATFLAADFDSSSGLISLDYTNGQKATGSVPGFLSSTDWTTFNNKVSTTRAINTTSPLSGGGDLSADRTLSIQDAAADGTTKGAATFLAADFNSSAGLISLDYTNGQKATGSVPGFLTAADWTTFNNKQAALSFGNLTAGSSKVTIGGTGTNSLIGSGASVDVNEANLTLSNMGGTLGVAHGGTGTSTSFTAGSIIFAGSSGVYTQNNSAFFWDNTNARLGLGITSPVGGAHFKKLGGDPVLILQPTNAVGNKFVSFTTNDSGVVNYGDFEIQSNLLRLSVVAALGFEIVHTSGLASLQWLTNSGAPFLQASNGTITGFVGHCNATDGFVSGSISSHPMVFRTNNSNRMYISSSGAVGIAVSSPSEKLEIAGNIKLTTAGNGFKLAEGTNATMGKATLSGGTVVVSTTKVTAASRIFLTIEGGTLTNVGSPYVSARTAGTSFTISSTNVLDASDVAWLIVEPA